jgi:hypothetical protein
VDHIGSQNESTRWSSKATIIFIPFIVMEKRNWEEDAGRKDFGGRGYLKHLRDITFSFAEGARC